MKAFTIIKDNKLVGMIKLNKEVLDQIAQGKRILLTSTLNRGDAVVLSFNLTVIKASQ